MDDGYCGKTSDSCHTAWLYKICKITCQISPKGNHFFSSKYSVILASSTNIQLVNTINKPKYLLIPHTHI